MSKCLISSPNDYQGIQVWEPLRHSLIYISHLMNYYFYALLHSRNSMSSSQTDIFNFEHYMVDSMLPWIYQIFHNYWSKIELLDLTHSLRWSHLPSNILKYSLCYLPSINTSQVLRKKRAVSLHNHIFLPLLWFLNVPSL